jgi:hypothetical protein
VIEKWKMWEGFYRFEVVGTREKVLLLLSLVLSIKLTVSSYLQS